MAVADRPTVVTGRPGPGCAVDQIYGPVYVVLGFELSRGELLLATT
jgi:hypothetical protein